MSRSAAPRRRGRILVGTSGWNYPSWRKHLYRGIPARAWLAQAAAAFDSIEINGSFYVQIQRETYRRWLTEVPKGFVFSLKGHRFLTHYKRLRDVAPSIALLRGQASALGGSLAVVVWQLPANLGADLERLRGFLRALRSWRSVRHSIEFRHRSWFVDEVADLLRRHRIAVCWSDAPDFPLWREITTDFVYVRLHGHTRKYASSYTRRHLARWAADARVWSREGRDVYVYLDNDAEGAAVRNAITLREMVRPKSVAPRRPKRARAARRKVASPKRRERAEPPPQAAVSTAGACSSLATRTRSRPPHFAR